MSNQETSNVPEEAKGHEGESHKIHGLIQLALVIAFIAGSLMVSSMLQLNKKQPSQRAAENRNLYAETMTSTPGHYQINFQTTGIVEARAEVNITPQISGRILSVNKNFFSGGQFEAGEILFEIEPLDFELELRRLQAQVAQARTAFNLEEAEAEAASAEWRQIHGDKPVPYLVARKPQKAEAWANLKAAKAQLEDAKLNLERTKFSLPFTGRVLSTNLEQGQFVTAGQSYGSVYDIVTLEVKSSLEDQQLGWLEASENPNIQIELTHLGKTKSYDSILQRGVSSLNPQTRFASVRFGFTEPPKDLVPGIFVDLTIHGPKLENVLQLPIEAIQKGELIWGVDENKKLYRLETKILFKDEKSVVLEGTGVPVRIVTSKMPGAIDGMTIQTAESTEE